MTGLGGGFTVKRMLRRAVAGLAAVRVLALTAATTDSNIAISSVDQTRVADDFDIAADAQPANRVHIRRTRNAFRGSGPPPLFPGKIVDAGMEMAYGAIAHSDPDSNTILQIVAPRHLFSLA